MLEQIEKAARPIERQSALFLVVRDDQFLIELRVKKGSGFYGQYRIPGGEIEPGEMPVEAAFREATEEIGIMPKRLVYLDTFNEVSLNNQFMRLHGFVIPEFAGEVRQMEPNKSILIWMSPKEACQKVLLASGRLTLNLTEDFLSREYQ